MDNAANSGFQKVELISPEMKKRGTERKEEEREQKRVRGKSEKV